MSAFENKEKRQSVLLDFLRIAARMIDRPRRVDGYVTTKPDLQRYPLCTSERILISSGTFAANGSRVHGTWNTKR